MKYERLGNKYTSKRFQLRFLRKKANEMREKKPSQPKNIIMHIAFVIVYEHINFPVKHQLYYIFICFASILLIFIGFLRIRDVVTYDG